MNWHVERDKETDLTIVRLSGEVTREGFTHLLEAVYKTYYSRHGLLDLSAASLLRIREGDIISFIEKGLALEKEHFPDGVAQPPRVAFFAPRDLNFGVARMWQSLTESYKREVALGVFRTEEEAMEWLLNIEEVPGEALAAS